MTIQLSSVKIGLFWTLIPLFSVIADENLEQTVFGVPLGISPLHDIVVTGPDPSYLSTYDTTSSTALYHYTGQGNLAVFTDGRPDDEFTFDMAGDQSNATPSTNVWELEVDVISSADLVP